MFFREQYTICLPEECFPVSNAPYIYICLPDECFPVSNAPYIYIYMSS